MYKFKSFFHLLAIVIPLLAWAGVYMELFVRELEPVSLVGSIIVAVVTTGIVLFMFLPTSGGNKEEGFDDVA